VMCIFAVRNYYVIVIFKYLLQVPLPTSRDLQAGLEFQNIQNVFESLLL